MMIQSPDRWAAKKTRKAESQYVFGETRRRPKTRMPRKTDSRKKENTPSAARGAPKMSPTVRA
jgi:hypothetical protein